jgi:hypothetical protein
MFTPEETTRLNAKAVMVLTKKGKLQQALAECATVEEKLRYLDKIQEDKQHLKMFGYTNGKSEAPIAREAYEYESDELITEGDPYFGICERRITFVSDIMPPEWQYQRDTGRDQNKPKYRNALDKAWAYNSTRPTSNKCWWTDENGAPIYDDEGYQHQNPEWDEAGYNDGRLPRHFVLKMGPPNGLYGHPDRLAARLRNSWQEHFKKRLQKSHVTIETEIPYSKKHTGTEYFKEYMDTLLDMTINQEKTRDREEKKFFGKRLTIKLAAESSERLLNASEAEFYPPEPDYNSEWRKESASRPDEHDWSEYVTCMIDLAKAANSHNMDWKTEPLATPEDTAQAKTLYVQQRKKNHHTRQQTASTALKHTQDFIRAVRRLGAPNNPEAAATSREVIVLDDDDDVPMVVEAGPQVSGKQMEAAHAPATNSWESQNIPHAFTAPNFGTGQQPGYGQQLPDQDMMHPSSGVSFEPEGHQGPQASPWLSTSGMQEGFGPSANESQQQFAPDFPAQPANAHGYVQGPPTPPSFVTVEQGGSTAFPQSEAQSVEQRIPMSPSQVRLSLSEREKLKLQAMEQARLYIGRKEYNSDAERKEAFKQLATAYFNNAVHHAEHKRQYAAQQQEIITPGAEQLRNAADVAGVGFLAPSSAQVAPSYFAAESQPATRRPDKFNMDDIKKVSYEDANADLTWLSQQHAAAGQMRVSTFYNEEYNERVKYHWRRLLKMWMIHFNPHLRQELEQATGSPALASKME